MARLLMNYLERVSEKHKCFFVDLFVRSTNKIAIEMYKKLGYDIYRTIHKYYGDSNTHKGENAYGKPINYSDMRKSLSRDPEKKLSKPTGKTIEPNELKWNWSIIQPAHFKNWWKLFYLLFVWKGSPWQRSPQLCVCSECESMSTSCEPAIKI